MKKNGKTSDREIIAAAAVRCFERYGPQRTSMNDIADEAGISRQSIYRLFEDRSALVHYILNQRIALMGKGIAHQFAKYTSLDEALVEGSVTSLNAARKDTLFSQIVADAVDHSIELFMMKGTPEIHNLMLSLWGPLIDKARKAGQLRRNLTNDRIVDWLRHFHSILTLRNDLDEKAQRQMLRDFLVPSLLTDSRVNTEDQSNLRDKRNPAVRGGA